MREKFGKHLTIILKKMCRIVGAKYEDMDFKKENWFYDYSWTEKQENDFLDWLAGYLFDNQEARNELTTSDFKNKKRCREAAANFIWNYGFKLDEEKNKEKGQNNST